MTRRQNDLLCFLRERQAKGATPSFGEMAKALGLRSKGSIHRLVAALQERGHIRRAPRRARAIELVERPPGQAMTLIAEALNHPAAELIEHAHPGWRSRARMLVGLRAAVAS